MFQERSHFCVEQILSSKFTLVISGLVKTVIHGPSIIQVRLGETLSLECSVSRLMTPPSNLNWVHDNSIITPNERPGVSLESEKLSGISRIKLVIISVSRLDSGMYQCSADSHPPAKIRVIVSGKF